MSVVYFVIQQTMYFAIPLLIVAIGAMYSERSGVINIAMEGIMVMGAFLHQYFPGQNEWTEIIIAGNLDRSSCRRIVFSASCVCFY